MPALARVFALKIALTLLAWSLPLLLLPASALEALGLAPQRDVLLLRLLGWAWLTLCVAYAFGLQAARARRAANGPVWVGIVSNGGAGALLLGHGWAGAWSHWPLALQTGAWLSGAATLALALALLYWGVLERDGTDRR